MHVIIQNENRIAIGEGEALQTIFKTHQNKYPCELSDLFVGLVQGATVKNHSNIKLFKFLFGFLT